MRHLIAAAVLTLVAAPAWSQAQSPSQARSCDELKEEIGQKIRSNGVVAFTLTVVDKDAQDDGKVVGTCGGATKKILYKRGAAPSGVESAAGN